MKKYYLFTVAAFLLLFASQPSQVLAEQQNTASQQTVNSTVPVSRPATATQPPAAIFGDSDLAASSDPFEEMEKVQQGMNKIFKESMRRVKNYQQSGKSFEPDADFLEQNGQYVLKVDLPGMQKDQINIEVAENAIALSGERKTERQVKTDKEGSFQFERSSGSFYRRLSLPADADSDKIQAKYENGVLEVSMPKLKSSSPEKKKVVIQ